MVCARRRGGPANIWREIAYCACSMCHKMAYKMEEAVGDSSNNRVANFQRCARELLRSALLEQHGSVNQSEATRSKVTKQRDMIRWA